MTKVNYGAANCDPGALILIDEGSGRRSGESVSVDALGGEACSINQSMPMMAGSDSPREVVVLSDETTTKPWAASCSTSTG